MEITKNGDAQMPFKTSALSVRGLRFHYSLSFNAISKISLIFCIRFTWETMIGLSSSNSIIIMRDKKNPGVHSQAAYLILVDLLSHRLSRRAF